MRILISGSSGFIGSALVSSLKTVHQDIFKLVRKQDNLAIDEISWSPDTGVIHTDLLEGFDAVINLAGENIMGRWSESKKQKIYDSRINSTTLLSDALTRLNQPPKVLVNASAIGIYGNIGDELVDETSPISNQPAFLVEVCKDWEVATQNAKAAGVRVVNLRIGAVLSTHGGALQKMLTPFKWGVGGVIGSGEQYMSWIMLEDLVKAIKFCITHETLRGPVNAVSPNPVTNREFTKTLGKILNRPTFITVPAFAVNLLLDGMGTEVLLTGQRVEPRALLEAGFRFSHPFIDEGLKTALQK